MESAAPSAPQSKASDAKVRVPPSRCDHLAVAEIAKLKQQYTPQQLKALLLDYQEREKRTEQLSLF